MWSGPPVEQLLPWGQLAALDVLNAAVGIIPQVDSTNSTNARFVSLFETPLSDSESNG